MDKNIYSIHTDYTLKSFTKLIRPNIDFACFQVRINKPCWWFFVWFCASKLNYNVLRNKKKKKKSPFSLM